LQIPISRLVSKLFHEKNPQKENTNESESKGPGFLFFSQLSLFFMNEWQGQGWQYGIFAFFFLAVVQGNTDVEVDGWTGTSFFFWQALIFTITTH